MATLLTCIIGYLALTFVGIIILAIAAHRAPLGREIPYVGFVRDE